MMVRFYCNMGISHVPTNTSMVEGAADMLEESEDSGEL